MATAARWYPEGLNRFLIGNLEWDATDTFNVALLADTYVYDADHTAYTTSVESHLASGSTPVALANKTVNVTSWENLPVWTGNAQRAVGDVVRAVGEQGSTGGEHVYRCVLAGQTGPSEPAWVTTSMRETVDGTVVWVEYGAKLVWLTSNAVQFSGTFTARQAVIYSQNYLVGHIDLGENRQVVDGTLTLTPSSTGWLRAGSGGSPT